MSPSRSVSHPRSSNRARDRNTVDGKMHGGTSGKYDGVSLSRTVIMGGAGREGERALKDGILMGNFVNGDTRRHSIVLKLKYFSRKILYSNLSCFESVFQTKMHLYLSILNTFRPDRC